MHLSLHSTFSTLAKGILRIAAFPGFAPFSWRDGSLARGRDIVFLRRFARLHGLEPVVMFHGFDRLWELPGQGVADVAASGISMRPACDGAIFWTRPYSEVRRTLLVRAGDTEVIHGMQGRTTDVRSPALCRASSCSRLSAKNFRTRIHPELGGRH